MINKNNQRVSFGKRLMRFFFPTLWDTSISGDQTYPEGTQLSFLQCITIMEGSGTKQITFAAVDRILDAFIDAVDKEGLACGGGVSPINPNEQECQRCEGLGVLRAPTETPVAIRLIEDKVAEGWKISHIERWVLLEWYCQLEDVTMDELRHYARSGERPESTGPHFNQLLSLINGVEGL